MKTSTLAPLLCLALFASQSSSITAQSGNAAAPKNSAVQIRFADSATGHAIPEASLLVLEHKAAVLEKRSVADKGGHASINLERGSHTITASSTRHHSISGQFELGENQAYPVLFLLDPLEPPIELQADYITARHRDDATLVQGFIVDDDSGEPLRNVRISSSPSGVKTESDARGFFQFYIPLPKEESDTADLTFQKPGYKKQERRNVELWPRGDWSYRIRMDRGNGQQTVDERNFRRRAPASPVPVTSTNQAPVASLEEELTFELAATASSNATVRVPRNIRVLKNSVVEYVTMNHYVKHVLPAEWISSWANYTGGSNSLNAGAVVIRGYAINKINNAGASSSYDICATSSCQVYGTSTTSATTKAVDYTEDYVIINSSGNVINSEYSAENNQLNKACGDTYTAPTSGCLYDPICPGETTFGHGRGLCQWGSARWATGRRMAGRNSGDGTPSGFARRDWIWILQHYFPNRTLVKGAPFVIGDDVKARETLNVRACSGGGIANGTSCALVTTKSTGATGVIIDGPTVITSDGKGFTWYKIQWNDVGSTTGWSAENYIERVFPNPSAPSGLAANAVATNQINLSWTDNSSVESGFKVERAPASSGPWIQIGVVNANVTSYSDKNLHPDSKWFYRVRSFNAGASSSYSSVANATTAGQPPILAAISNKTVNEGTLLTFTNSATVSDRVQLITDFEAFMSETADGVVLFKNPLSSSTTAGFMVAVPDLATVTDAFPTNGHGTGNVFRVSCDFTNVNNAWLRLHTADTATFPNPVIDFTKKFQFDIYSDKATRVGIGCRETTTVEGTAIGSDGGSTGAIEWAGVTNISGAAPMPNRSIAAGSWTTLTFDLPNEPIRNFSGGNGVLSTASGLGVLQHLAIVPKGGTGVYNIYLDNFAVLTPRNLTYSLGAGAPSGASINPTTGVFTWTPTEAQGPSTNNISVIATDNSVPALKTTNIFSVVVSEINVAPVLASIANKTVVGGSVLTFTNTATDADLPANTLTYSLDAGAPAGASVHASTGVFTWTTPVAPSTNSITVRVTDNGSPALSNTKTFTATVVTSPTITSQPESQTTFVSSNVTFSVTATGTAPLTYQWRFNGTNISGATTTSLARNNVQLTDAGNYSVVVSNSVGSITSANALLTIQESLSITGQPQNRTNNIGDNAQFTVVATGTNLTYQWQLGGANISGATDSALSFLVTNANLAGTYSVVVSSPSANLTSASALLVIPYADRTKITQWDHNNSPYTGSSTTTPSYGSGSVTTVGDTASDGSAPRPGVNSDPTAGNNYARSHTRPQSGAANKSSGIQYNASTAGYTNIVVTWEQRVGERASGYWRGQYTTNGTTWIDRVVVDKRALYVQQGGEFYAYHFDNLSGVAGVHNNANFGYRIVAEYQSTATGSGSAAYVSADPNNTYNGTGNPVSRYDMMTVMGTPIVEPIVITIQPQGATLAVGANHTFNVTATGTLPKYQWRFNGANMSGKTTSSLAMSNLQLTDSGNYTVVITNSASVVTSAVAALTVQAPISITGQPQSQTNYVSSNVTFSVTATGTSPKYQWRFNAANISGATQSSYTRSNIQLSDAGNYSVIVSNSISSVTSANGALTVLPLPVERYWSGDGLNLGGAGTWNTTANRWAFTSGGPFAYAWNNANEDSAIFSGTAGALTVGSGVTVNKIIFAIAGYSVSGSSAITFAGEDAGIFSPGANNTSTTNTMTVSSPLAGPLLVKTGGGRLNLNNTGNTVGKWVVKGGIISANSANLLFGTAIPAELVADFITLDGGGLGIANNGISIGANRGIYLGTNSGNKIGVTSSSTTLTVDGPITGPGGISFPGFSSFPGQVHGGAGTFVFSNPENDYEGATTVSVGELQLGASEVLPNTTVLTLSGSNGRLNLNGFNETVATLVLNGSGARVIGSGTLLADSYDLRNGGITTAILGGDAALVKTTANNVTLHGENSYTGDTTISEGTITINGAGRFGDGSGNLNLAGGGIILSESRSDAATLLNPVVMTADATIQNGSTGTDAILFRHGGSWTTDAGTLTIRNATSTGAGSFDLVLSNTIHFTQPIVIGLGGEKPCQLTSYNPSVDLDPEGNTQIFSAGISGTGSFRRSVGSGVGGRTIFTADNIYSGGTVVDAGTLLVNNSGSGSGTGSGSVSVSGSGILSGSGIVGGNVAVNSGGSISAGDGIGVLTLQSGLNMSGGGTNVWELAAFKDDSSGTAGTDFDQIVLTGGQLQLGGSSKLLLKFAGEASAPTTADPFWRYNRSWKIVRLNGGQNTTNAAFGSIVSATYSAGFFSNHVDVAGNIILTYTSYTTNELFWSGNGSALGGTGTWNATNLRWGNSSSGPFNRGWTNASSDSAIFEGTAGTVTVGAAVTVNRITIAPVGYSFAGTSKITFSGADAGMDYRITTAGDANKLSVTCPLGGSVMTKSGAGRVHLSNTGNTVSKWVVKGGIISPATIGALGAAPGSLVADLITLDGGGIGFDGTSPTLGTTRGITLGTGNGNKLGVRDTTATLTINGPITGPGGISFPGYGSFPSQIHGGAGIFIFSSQNNNYQGATTVSVGELKLGASGVLPDTTTLTLSGSTGRLNLNGFSETVSNVVINGSGARIIGSGILTSSNYDLRNGGVTTAVLGGNANLTKTTANNVTLQGTNTYTGSTTLVEGSVTINDVGRFGNGAGVLNLAGGDIILSSNRTEAATLMNPVVMSADTTIGNANTGTGAILFRSGGTWTTEGGTLTIRNNTSTGAGSFDVVLTNVFSFTQPIVIGAPDEKPCQLTSFNPQGDQTFGGEISGIGTVRRSVSSGVGGRTIFTADNIYSGGTILEKGTLLVNNPGPGSGTGSGIVKVGAGAALGGNGFIGGNVIVSNSASISAGTNAGVLTLRSGLNLNNGGTNVWDLTALVDGTNGTVGADYDQLVIAGGELQLGGSSRLLLKFSGGASAPNTNSFWNSNHSWKIINVNGGANTANATFSSIVNGTYSAGNFSTAIALDGSIVLNYIASGSRSVPETTAPALQLLVNDAAETVLNWNTVPGRKYEVRYSTNLSEPNWQFLTNFVADGESFSLTNSATTGEAQRFYRVVLE